jgi:hypothetical protein
MLNCISVINIQNSSNYNKQLFCKVQHDNLVIHNFEMYYRPYSDVNNIITDWKIDGDEKASASAYWQYLYVKHEEKFAEHYNVTKATDVPGNWRRTTVQEALKNLRDKFTMAEGN